MYKIFVIKVAFGSENCINPRRNNWIKTKKKEMIWERKTQRKCSKQALTETEMKVKTGISISRNETICSFLQEGHFAEYEYMYMHINATPRDALKIRWSSRDWISIYYLSISGYPSIYYLSISMHLSSIISLSSIIYLKHTLLIYKYLWQQKTAFYEIWETNELNSVIAHLTDLKKKSGRIWQEFVLWRKS